MAQKYKIWTDGKIYINEKPININGVLDDLVVLSPKSEINISNIQFYIDFDVFRSYPKFKIIPKIQFIKNGQKSNWMTLVDASQNILPIEKFFYGEDRQDFARWVKVDGDTSSKFEKGRRKKFIDKGTAYSHDLSVIDYPGTLHFTPEFGSQEIPNKSEPDDFKLVKRILTKSASKDHTKYRLSGNAMNWITRAENADYDSGYYDTSSGMWVYKKGTDIAYKQKDFIDFRMKFGIYKFNKSTGEYNDESNEVYSTDYKSNAYSEDNHLLRDTIFRVYLSPDIINNESLKYVKNIFGKNFSGETIYDYNNNYYKGSFIWNTNKNPLSGRIAFNDSSETNRLLIDYTHYDGTDYSGYYPGPATGSSFNRKVLNKYKFKVLAADDMKLLEDSEYRQYSSDYRFTSPYSVYTGNLPGSINLNDFKNRDLLITSGVGYEVSEFASNSRIGETYYYPYYVKYWPDDDLRPRGYLNIKDSREQKLYHYISPSVGGKIEFYNKVNNEYKDLTKKDNKECIGYNNVLSFKFKRNIGRWISSLNDGDKYIIQLKFTYRLNGDTSDTVVIYNVSNKIFKGSTNISVSDAEKATEETIFDLPAFSSMLPGIFKENTFADVKIEAFYNHCYGNSAYGYSNSINNYTTESAKIFTTKLRIYEQLLITADTPECVFYDEDNNLCESIFESSENMIVDFNTYAKLNCVNIKNINSVLASYVPNHFIDEIAFNTLVTDSSNSPKWSQVIRHTSLPGQPPLGYFYFSEDTNWIKDSYIYGPGVLLWGTKDSVGPLSNMQITTKDINCIKISNTQIQINLSSMESYLGYLEVTGKTSDNQTITLKAWFRNDNQKPTAFKTESTPYDEAFNNKPLGLVDTSAFSNLVNSDNSRKLDILFGILNYNNNQYTDNYYLLFDLQQETDVEHFGDLSFILKSTNMIDIYPPSQVTQFFNSVTFVLETSIDGETWTQVSTATITTSNMHSTELSFDDVTCRYIKLELSDISFNTNYNTDNVDMGVVKVNCDISITTNDYNITQANVEVYEDLSKTSKICDIDYNNLDDDIGSKILNTTSNELYIFNKTDCLLTENNFKLVPINNMDIYNSRNYYKTWSTPVKNNSGNYDDYIFTGCVCNYDVKVLNTNYNKTPITLYKYTLQADKIKNMNRGQSHADETDGTENRFYFYYNRSDVSNSLPGYISDSDIEKIDCVYGDVVDIPLTPISGDTEENTITVLLMELDSLDDTSMNNVLVWSDTNCNSILFNKSDIESGQVSFTLAVGQNDIVPSDFKIIPKNLISTSLDKKFECNDLIGMGGSGTPFYNQKFTGISSIKNFNRVYRVKADTTYYFPDIDVILDNVSHSEIGNFEVSIQFYTKDGKTDESVNPGLWNQIIYKNTDPVVSLTYIDSPAHNSLKDGNNRIMGDPYYMTINFSLNEAATMIEDYFYLSEEPGISKSVNDNDFKRELVGNGLYKYTWDIPQNILNSYISNIDYNIKFLPVNLNDKYEYDATQRRCINKGSTSHYEMNLNYISDTGIFKSKIGRGTNPNRIATYNNRQYYYDDTWTSTLGLSVPNSNITRYKFNLIQEALWVENAYTNCLEQIYYVQPNTWYVVCNADSVEFFKTASKMEANLNIFYAANNIEVSNSAVTNNRPTNSSNLFNNTSHHPMLAYSGNNGYIMVVKQKRLSVISSNLDDKIQVYYENNSNYAYKLNVYDIGPNNSDSTRAITFNKGVKHFGYVEKTDNTQAGIVVWRNAWQGIYRGIPHNTNENEELYLNLTRNTSYSIVVIHKNIKDYKAEITKGYEYLTLTTELRTGLPNFNSFRFISSLEDMSIKYPKLTIDDINDYNNILNVFNDSNTSMVINSPYDDDINTYIQTIRPGIYTHSRPSGQSDPYNPDYTYMYHRSPRLVHKYQGYDNPIWNSFRLPANQSGTIKTRNSYQNILIYNNSDSSLLVDLYDAYDNLLNDETITISGVGKTRIKLTQYGDVYDVKIHSSYVVNCSYILYNDYVLDSLDVKRFDESDSTFIYNYDSERKQLNYKLNTSLIPATNIDIYYNIYFEWYKRLHINALGKSFEIPYKNYIDLNLNRIEQKYISEQCNKFYANSNMDDKYEDNPEFISGENYIKYDYYFDSYGVDDFSVQNGKQSVYKIEYPSKREQYEILPLSFYDDLFSILGVINYKINYYIKNGLMKISRLPNEVGDVIESIFILADFRSLITVYSGNIKIYAYDNEGNKTLVNMDYLRDDVIYRMSWIVFGENCCYVEIVLLEDTEVTINQLLRSLYILPETYQEHNCSVLRLPTTKNYYWNNESEVNLDNYSYVNSEKEMLIKPIIHEPSSTTVIPTMEDNTDSWSPSNISDTIRYTYNEDKVINTLTVKTRKRSNYFIQVQYKSSEQSNYQYITDSDGNIITFSDFNKDCLNIKTFNFKNIKANQVVITFNYEEKYDTDVDITEDEYYFIGFSDDSYNDLSFIDSSNHTYVDWGCVPGLYPTTFKDNTIWSDSSKYLSFTRDNKIYMLYTSVSNNDYVSSVEYDSSSDTFIINFNQNVARLLKLDDNTEIITTQSTRTSSGVTKNILLYSLKVYNVSELIKYNYFSIPYGFASWVDYEHNIINISKRYLYLNSTNYHNNDNKYNILPVIDYLDYQSSITYKNNNNLKGYDFNDSSTQFSLVSVDSNEEYGEDFDKEFYIIFKNKVTKNFTHYSRFYYLDIDTNVFSDISIPARELENVIKVKLSDNSKQVNYFKIMDNTGLIHNIAIYNRFGEGLEPSHYTSINWNETHNIITTRNYYKEGLYKVHFSNSILENVSTVTESVGSNLENVLKIRFDDNIELSNSSVGTISDDKHQLTFIIDTELKNKETLVKVIMNRSIEYIGILNGTPSANITSEVENSLLNNPTNVYRYDISSINDTSRVKVGNANIEFDDSGIGIWEKITSDTSSNNYFLKYKFYLTDSNTHAVNSIQKAKAMYVELDNFTETSGYDFSVSNAYWNNRTLQISKLKQELMTYNTDDEYVFPQKRLLNQRQIISSTLIPYGSTMEFLEYVNSEGASVLIHTYEFETGGFNNYDDMLKLKLNFLSNYVHTAKTDYTYTNTYTESLNLSIDISVNFYDSSDKSNLIFTELNTISITDVLPHEFSFSYIDMTQIKYVEFIFALSNWEFTKTLDIDEFIRYFNFEMAYGLHIQSTQSLDNTYIINHNSDLYDTMINEDESDNLTIVNESDNHPDSDYADDRKYRDFSGDIIHIMRDED